MYALSLQLTYALALLFGLAMVFFYLPYLLVGFLILLAVVAVAGGIAWFVLKRKYGHLFKMMDPEAMMKMNNPNMSNSADNLGRGQTQGDIYDTSEGTVIQVKAEDIS